MKLFTVISLSPSPNKDYVGRFAPSPTGPLHFGSLVAAVASYIDAKKHNGKWFLRIEDCDSDRVDPQHSSSILKTLENHGLQWDGEVLYQSQRKKAYEDAFQELKKQNAVYACVCSRKDLELAHIGKLGPVYPRNCYLKNLKKISTSISWRFKMPEGEVFFKDRILGDVKCNSQKDLGDVVVFRKEELPAYHLMSVVDDAYQNITDVVRGEDLLYCSFPQIELRKNLQLNPVTYAHLPIVKNEQGEKLSKQTQAPKVDLNPPLENLYKACEFLGLKMKGFNSYQNAEDLLKDLIALKT